MRKIVQISAIPSSDGRSNGTFSNDETVYALCDDGEVFWLTMSTSGAKWAALPQIPQDDES